jgi:uncharacterized membrane protein YidH (DUF202 family)
VRSTVAKLFVAALVALCIGVQVLEASGHWDRAFQDANDEASIVAVVLCLGAALAIAGALLGRMRPSRTIARTVVAPTTPFTAATRTTCSVSCAGPPVRLRI